MIDVPSTRSTASAVPAIVVPLKEMARGKHIKTNSVQYIAPVGQVVEELKTADRKQRHCVNDGSELGPSTVVRDATERSVVGGV